MNLRITDAAGPVGALDDLLRRTGEPVHAAGGWTVVRVGNALFCYGPGGERDGGCVPDVRPASDSPRTPEAAATPEVGGPYPTLSALLRDAGRRVGASPEVTPGGDPVWEIRAWADGYYLVWASGLHAPLRHEGPDSALAEASRQSRSDSDSARATN